MNKTLKESIEKIYELDFEQLNLRLNYFNSIERKDSFANIKLSFREHIEMQLITQRLTSIYLQENSHLNNKNVYR